MPISQPSSSSLWKLPAAGLAIGALAAVLVAAGNPGNMGVCVACFLRDIAGSFGGARLGMAGVAYLRPEILGLVLGALGAAALSGEFRPRGGVAFAPRFLLGFVFMVAALVFLGCTVRVWLRIGGGDLNALVGAAGLAAGVAAGALLLRAGYALPGARPLSRAAGLRVPAVAVALLALAVTVAAAGAPGFLTVTPAPAPAPIATAAAPAGPSLAAPSAPPRPTPPGGKRAPLALSLLAGLAVGAIAQRSRLCTTGPIRDLVLWRSPAKLLGIAGLVAGAAAVNLALGQFRPGFAGQPVAHTDALANFAAMAVAGLAAVLMGGCPLRQLVMAGEGDADAGGAVAGMVAGALVAHGAGLASSPRGPAPGALPLLAILAAVTVAFALWTRARAMAATGAAAAASPDPQP